MYLSTQGLQGLECSVSHLGQEQQIVHQAQHGKEQSSRVDIVIQIAVLMIDEKSQCFKKYKH